MFSAVRRRLTYANVAMTLALVFAMSGGAYAAGKYLISSTKQISPKVLKSLVGKAGPAGKNGTNGTNGTNGAPGAAGEKGPQGPQGPEGKEGKQGEPGKEGKAGEPGKNGLSGFTKTLPPEETETGAWSYGDTPAPAGPQPLLYIPISFSIPLSVELGETQVHFINAHNEEVVFPEPVGKTVFGGSAEVEQKSKECTGSAAAPTAAPGNLCVYVAEQGERPFLRPFQTPGTYPFGSGAGTTGTILRMKAESEGKSGYGTWAVTAPAAP